MIFKKPSLNYGVCEEEFCQEESTKIWANTESKIVDLCDLHYSQAIKQQEER